MNSAEDRPNQGAERKPIKGVPDLSDLMNQGNKTTESSEAVDLSSLMSEIRRVPTAGAPKSLAPSHPRKHKKRYSRKQLK